MATISVEIPAKKISELPSGDPVVASDLLPTVQDMAGTPTTKKITAELLNQYKWIEMENKDSVPLIKGNVVTRHSSLSGCIRASADNAGTLATGLLLADAAVGFSAKTVSSGTIRLMDWTAITGTETLTAGIYYLDTVAGKLTSTPPSVEGQYVQRVGVALSAYDLEVNIEAGILL